ncbi:MAG TPA: nucleotidyltransferase family protein [Candidatus Dormibacteraeota bacterium]|nr:nucleotidyltransferase family protein [Candidatus Dormibacteraeota bacterium]
MAGRWPPAADGLVSVHSETVVYLMSDLDLPLRDRIYREPEGPHVAIVRGRDLEAALDHLDARPDCRALAIIGLPRQVPDLELLSGRRLLVCDGDRALMREFAEAGMAAGAEVEWLNSSAIDYHRIAAWALPVGAIVLAAGAAIRMGRNKLLLEVGGKPLVRHVVEAASEGGCHCILAVYAEEAVRAAVEDAATVVHNPDAATGQSSSLKAGLHAMPEEIAGALVMLGDQPLVGARTVSMLLKAWRREGARPAVAAAYGGRDAWRPPVLIDRSLWPELMQLQGDEGARRLFAERPELLDTVPAVGRADDIDTPEDYASIVHLFPRRDPG